MQPTSAVATCIHCLPHSFVGRRVYIRSHTADMNAVSFSLDATRIIIACGRGRQRPGPRARSDPHGPVVNLRGRNLRRVVRAHNCRVMLAQCVPSWSISQGGGFDDRPGGRATNIGRRCRGSCLFLLLLSFAERWNQKGHYRPKVFIAHGQGRTC